MTKWLVQFRVASVVVRISSDSAHFKTETDYLTRLYQADTRSEPDLHFHLRHQPPFYALLLEDNLIWQSVEPRDIAPALEVQLYQQILNRIGHDYLSLHASTVDLNGKACLFAGVSGAGKSSLCTAALLAGASYLTDEFSLLGRDGKIHPFPRPLQWDDIDHPAFSQQQLLRSGLFEKGQYHFPDINGNTLTSHLWLPKHVQREALTVGYLILPSYQAAAPAAALAPIRRSEALMRLQEHLHLRLPPAEIIKQLNRRLPSDTRCYTLEFSDVYAAWDTLRGLDVAI